MRIPRTKSCTKSSPRLYQPQQFASGCFSWYQSLDKNAYIRTCIHMQGVTVDLSTICIICHPDCICSVGASAMAFVICRWISAETIERRGRYRSSYWNTGRLIAVIVLRGNSYYHRKGKMALIRSIRTFASRLLSRPQGNISSFATERICRESERDREYGRERSMASEEKHQVAKLAVPPLPRERRKWNRRPTGSLLATDSTILD